MEEKNTVEEFENVFNEAVAEGGESVAPTSEQPEEKQPEEKKDDRGTPTEENVSLEEDEASNNETTPTESETEDVSVPEDYKKLEQRYKSLQGMYNSQVKKLRELEERFNQVQSVQPQPEEKPQSPTDLFEDEELIQTFSELEEDFPTIAEFLKKTLSKVTTKITAKQEEALKRQIEAIRSQLPQPNPEDQLKKVQDFFEEKNLPDALDLLKTQELGDWVETLPERKRKFYYESIQLGDLEGVATMLKEYKDVANIAPSSKKQQKLQNMAGVSSRSTPVLAQSKKPKGANEFESAFLEALEMN